MKFYVREALIKDDEESVIFVLTGLECKILLKALEVLSLVKNEPLPQQMHVQLSEELFKKQVKPKG